jgi:hypothetical protein
VLAREIAQLARTRAGDERLATVYPRADARTRAARDGTRGGARGAGRDSRGTDTRPFLVRFADAIFPSQPRTNVN